MILSKTVKIQISNNKRYWCERGYSVRKGDIINPPIEQVPLNSNKLVLSKCDECGLEWTQPYQVAMKSIKTGVHRCRPCNRKHIGKIMDKTKMIELLKARIGPLHPQWNPDKSELTIYSRKVRWLTSKTYKENSHIINPLNLPRTLCGVEGGYQLDHKISIRAGFYSGMPPEEISKLDNLQLLSWKDNRNKWYS